MNRIAERLEELGKSQRWLAQKAGISEGHLSEIINNTIQYPRINTCCKIYKALESMPEDLWYYDQ